MDPIISSDIPNKNEEPGFQGLDAQQMVFSYYKVRGFWMTRTVY